MADESRYVVVRFIHESTSLEACVSEVPSNWLVEERFCYWPNKSKYSINYLIQNRVPPNIKTWIKHEIVIELECDTLEIARKKATELLSSEDEENKGRGKRNIVRPRKYSNDDSSSSSYQSESSWQKQTNLTQPPILKTIPSQVSCGNHSSSTPPVDQAIGNIGLECNNHNTVINDIENIPVIFEGSIPLQQPHIWDNRTVVENATIPGFRTDRQILQNIERLLPDLKIQTHSMEQRLQHLENILAGQLDGAANTVQDEDILGTLLPLKSLEDLNNFESLLTTNMNMAVAFKKRLKRIGAKDPKENVQRIGSKIFTNKLLVGCSWKGRSSNFKMCNLIIMQLIKDVIISSFHFYQEVTFEHDMAEWIRFAKQRLIREQK